MDFRKLSGKRRARVRRPTLHNGLRISALLRYTYSHESGRPAAELPRTGARPLPAAGCPEEKTRTRRPGTSASRSKSASTGRRLQAVRFPSKPSASQHFSKDLGSPLLASTKSRRNRDHDLVRPQIMAAIQTGLCGRRAHESHGGGWVLENWPKCLDPGRLAGSLRFSQC
jgi:hypothetical protein